QECCRARPRRLVLAGQLSGDRERHFSYVDHESIRPAANSSDLTACADTGPSTAWLTRAARPTWISVTPAHLASVRAASSSTPPPGRMTMPSPADCAYRWRAEHLDAHGPVPALVRTWSICGYVRSTRSAA